MHTKTLVFGLVIGLLLGGGSTYAATQFIASNQDQPQPSATDVVTLPTTQPQQVIAGDVDSGDGLTPAQMFDELQTAASSDEFDRKFMTYMMLLKSNENGMARLVTEKTQRPELNTLATNISDENKPDIDSMRIWQRIWGLTDH